MSDEIKTVEHKSWIGCDLDGTLAHYDGWRGPMHIGEPVGPMVKKVKALLAAGTEVRIFTARAWPLPSVDVETAPPADWTGVTEPELRAWQSIAFIRDWCETHLGQILPITCQKDFGMIMLFDDRCTYVFPNEGITHQEHQGFLMAEFANVARSLGVKIEQGANFKTIADACSERARAGNPHADLAEKALALLDGCEDAMSYAAESPALTGIRKGDLTRALQQFGRAMPMLRQLAGKKEGAK